MIDLVCVNNEFIAIRCGEEIPEKLPAGFYSIGCGLISDKQIELEGYPSIEEIPDHSFFLLDDALQWLRACPNTIWRQSLSFDISSFSGYTSVEIIRAASKFLSALKEAISEYSGSASSRFNVTVSYPWDHILSTSWSTHDLLGIADEMEVEPTPETVGLIAKNVSGVYLDCSEAEERYLLKAELSEAFDLPEDI